MNVRSGNDFVSCSSNVSSSKYESPRKWVPKFSQHTSASQQPARRLSASCTNRFSPLLTPAPSSSSIADDFEKPSDTEQWSHEPLCPICYEEYDVFDFFQLECCKKFIASSIKMYQNVRNEPHLDCFYIDSAFQIFNLKVVTNFTMNACCRT